MNNFQLAAEKKRGPKGGDSSCTFPYFSTLKTRQKTVAAATLVRTAIGRSASVVAAKNSNGLAAANNQPAETDAQSTNDLDYPTGKRLRKAESILLAHIAFAGFDVHCGDFDDYTVCKSGQAHYFQDLASLERDAHELGAMP